MLISRENDTHSRREVCNPSIHPKSVSGSLAICCQFYYLLPPTQLEKWELERCGFTLFVFWEVEKFANNRNFTTLGNNMNNTIPEISLFWFYIDRYLSILLSASTKPAGEMRPGAVWVYVVCFVLGRSGEFANNIATLGNNMNNMNNTIPIISLFSFFFSTYWFLTFEGTIYFYGVCLVVGSLQFSNNMNIATK